MPSHKEVLEELQFEIENLSGKVTEGSKAIERQGQNQTQAAEILSKGLKGLGGDLITAAAVAGVLLSRGRAEAELIDLLTAIKRKTEMIKSIQKLQKQYSSLSYEFIVERSFVEGASKDTRQNILNELLHTESVTTKESEQGEVLSIEPDNPELIAYWKRLDAFREILSKGHRRLS